MSVHASMDDGLGKVVLDHPPLNILTREVMAGLRRELARLAQEPTLRVLILRAEGKHFSAGADVGEHLPPEYRELIPEFTETVDDLASFPLPVIAAVQGRCLGGGFELAMAADIIVATEGASFGQPEILLGVLPPAACAMLPLRLPHGLAAEIVLGGDAFAAEEAERIGLVRRVVPEAELGEATTEIARKMTRHSAAALRIGKRMLAGEPGPLRRALDRAGALYVDELMETEDAREGLQAFIEKRRPEWRHR
ncbi:MAG: enoyl-CoA hydratase/isomerase family protein [Candidatus Palauibacterales bacterium]|nr:enoyl-CoA hydratase/isomerase family protein [Candidatus Palauibacterales bacterium]